MKFLARMALAACLLVMLAPPMIVPAAAGEPMPLAWSQLVPPLAPGEVPKRKGMFDILKDSRGTGTRPPLGDAAVGHSSLQQVPGDAAWMSLKRQQPGAGQPPRIVTALDGKRVALGGYVVPLDFQATRITEFLLVPFVGACIHVPPPPANQIVYVKFPAGLDLLDLFMPVKVIGAMQVATTVTGLADTGYTINADAVEPGAGG